MSAQIRFKQLQGLIAQTQEVVAEYRKLLATEATTGDRLGLKHRLQDALEQLETYQDELAELEPTLDANRLITLNVENFKQEVGQSQLPVLIDCWAEWCGPCKQLIPMIEELSQEFNGRVKFCKLNVDQASGLADRLDVQSLPTLLLFHRRKLVARIGGVPAYGQLVAQLQSVLD